MKELDKLLEYQKQITDIQYTINLLNWNLRVSTPANAVDDLINLITSYDAKLFELQTSKTYFDLLNNVINSIDFKKLDIEEQRYILILFKRYNQNSKIPSDFYTNYKKLIKKANAVWRTAKEQNDYQMFKPYLKELIEITKKYYRFIDSETDNLYDVMLNQYEIGIKSDLIDKLFNELKDFLVPLISKVSNDKVSMPKIKYTEKELMDCAEYLLNYIGFDMSRGMLGIYPHGFTEKIGPNDIRIAFKHSNNPIDFAGTMIHEGGHGIFEQNISSNLSRYDNQCIGELYALHESQSRFYENILGRNINFWVPIYDVVKEKLKLNISLEEFSELLNTIKPGLIRVEADELTYCLHIIIRYEIERDLFNGKIDIEDLPKVWNQKMKEYLNVDVTNDSEGLMQDVHWSEGSFGYFPSYLLGTIYDGMIKKAVERDIGDIDELLRNGQIKVITKYLIDNIYKNGGAYTSLEVLEKLYKKPLSSKPIIEHFQKKYGTIVK